MARKPKEKVNGVVTPPDYALAASIFRNDILPANTEQGRAMKDASDAYKSVKKEAHVHPWAVRQCAGLLKNEDAERDVKLRDLNGMMKALGIKLRADLVDISEGASPDDEIDIIPVAPAAASDLHLVN